MLRGMFLSIAPVKTANTTYITASPRPDVFAAPLYCDLMDSLFDQPESPHCLDPLHNMYGNPKTPIV